MIKKWFLAALIILCNYSILLSQPLAGSYYDFLDATKDLPVGHDKTSLIIYRPQNNGTLNDIRCFIKIEDENNNDVTYDKNFIWASYEWVTSNPDQIFNYKKTYWLSGDVAMHLRLKKGKYKISVYTPVDKQNNWTYPDAETKTFEWKSNIFEYNTENPAKVIFVLPVTNDNGFYKGEWFIDYKAPKYFKNRTIQKMESQSE